MISDLIIEASVFFHQTYTFFLQVFRNWCYSFFIAMRKTKKTSIDKTIGDKHVLGFSNLLYKVDICVDGKN